MAVGLRFRLAELTAPFDRVITLNRALVRRPAPWVKLVRQTRAAARTTTRTEQLIRARGCIGPAEANYISKERKNSQLAVLVR